MPISMTVLFCKDFFCYSICYLHSKSQQQSPLGVLYRKVDPTMIHAEKNPTIKWSKDFCAVLSISAIFGCLIVILFKRYVLDCLCLSFAFRTCETKVLQYAAQHWGVSVLLPVAPPWQSPCAAEAQAASISTGEKCPAQEGQRQTAQPGAEKSAVPLPEVLVGTGEKANKLQMIMCFTALQHIVQEYNGSDNSKPRQHKVLYIKHAGPKEHKRKAHMYLQRIKNKIAPNTRVNITDESSAVRDIKKSLQKRRQRMANMDLKEQSTPLVMSGSLFWLYGACFSVLSLHSV